ncbi:MAG: hypothetical protein ACI9KN_002513 [Gammaproteobacteria bacterium]|jgi:hypothetical protein
MGGAEEEETRADFNDVRDFNSLPDTLVRDQNNIAIGSLSGYTVTVTIPTTVDANTLNSIPIADSLQINITVNHAAIDPINLTGYRTDYNGACP